MQAQNIPLSCHHLYHLLLILQAQLGLLQGALPDSQTRFGFPVLLL